MIREWWSKLCRILTGRQGLAGDLNAELAAHLEFEIQENIARGVPPDEARAAARRHVGNLTQIQERAADAWSFPSLETIDRKSTRLNSSHRCISYAVFCLKK